MDADLEWSIWRQLGGAFGIDKFIFTPEVSSVTSSKVIQTSSMDEALTFATGKLIFLEPWAENNLADLPKLNNYTLIYHYFVMYLIYKIQNLIFQKILDSNNKILEKNNFENNY